MKQYIALYVFICFYFLSNSPSTGAEVNGTYVPDWVYNFWGAEWNMYSDKLGRFKGDRKMNGTNQSPNTVHAAAHLLDSDDDPLDIVLRRTEALLQYMKGVAGAPDLSAEETDLASIKSRISGGGRRDRYNEVCLVRRQISLKNPLLDFDEILTISWFSRGGVLQESFNCTRSSEGGSLYAVSGWKNGDPQFRNILENSTFENGMHAGKRLSSLGGRHFSSFDLHYDGSRIVFGFGSGGDCEFHLYQVNQDGTGLRAVLETDFHLEVSKDGGINDGRPAPESIEEYSPAWLPNGRIAFVTTRQGGYVRCNPDVYRPQARTNLWSIKPDGTDLVRLSWHETNEWTPSVNHYGQIVYTRWDYIDRGFNAAHHIWICGPDGTDPRAPHGNYPLPHDGERAKYLDDRPWSEFMIRPVPGSDKYIAIASSHHCSPHGEIVLIDTRVEDDNAMSQVERITNPDFAMPHEVSPGNQEVWPLGDNSRHYYTTATALSEEFYMAPMADEQEMLLMDKFGNRITLFRLPGGVPPRYPTPLRARSLPPVIPARTFQGERLETPEHHRAVISMMNVYEADFTWPDNTRIKELRIVQALTRPTMRYDKNTPKIAEPCSGQMARMILGVVPVEEDGSAYFEAPVEKEIYFQALDEHGYAVQSMRSGTYVHPGEHLTCVGCHENKWKAVPPMPQRLALMRPPSPIAPEPGGVQPANFFRMAEPVLNDKCSPCHRDMNQGPDYASMGYADIVRDMKVCYMGGEGDGGDQGQGYRSDAGNIGAYKTVMGRTMLEPGHMKYITEGHYTRDEMRQVSLWLDMSAPRYGTYMYPGEEERGELVWPYHDVDPDNPLGVESDRPLRQQTAALYEIEQKYGKESACSRIRIKAGLAGGRPAVFAQASDPGGIMVLARPDGSLIARQTGIRAGTNRFRSDDGGSGIYIVQIRFRREVLSKLLYVK